MAIVFKASEFIEKLKDVEKNYKTLYVMGCFGAPLNTKNKKRYCENHTYNKQVSRTKLIQAASSDTFGFDCVNLIKGVLWGWNGDKTKNYGGAKYKAHDIPDVNADGMIALCKDANSDFTKIEPGEALWSKGHIGIYIGDGLAIECTPAWKNKVQITAVKNIGTKTGYNARQWTKHGHIPYIEYDITTPVKKTATKKPPAATTKAEPAQKKDSKLAGTYKVTAPGALHIRAGAGTNKKSLGTLKKDAIVNNYGYYSYADNGAAWLYVKTSDGIIGYCSLKYLRKC